jgi:hypothetical protein
VPRVPSSGTWVLGLFPRIKNSTPCHPEERLSAKRIARRRTRRRTSTLASCLPSQSRIRGAPPSICEGGSWGLLFRSSNTKNCHPERSPRSKGSAFPSFPPGAASLHVFREGCASRPPQRAHVFAFTPPTRRVHLEQREGWPGFRSVEPGSSVYFPELKPLSS